MTSQDINHMSGSRRAWLAASIRMQAAKFDDLTTDDLDQLQAEIEAGRVKPVTAHYISQLDAADAQRRADRREDFQTRADAGRGLA